MHGLLALALALSCAPASSFCALAIAADAERAAPGLLAPVQGNPPAPPLRLDTLDGAPGVAPLERAADGRATIVHFFATWCVPCRTELPALAQFARRSGVPVLLVDVAEPEDRIRRFLAEQLPFAGQPIPGPVLLDRDRAAARGWDVSLLPASFVVVSGRLRFTREGEVDWAAPATASAIAPVSDIKTQGGHTQ